MGYRENWFKKHYNPLGVYQCRNCHGWFKENEIDIDHIIPRKHGGTDADYNLQPLCYHCNRSKQASMNNTGKDLVVNGVHNIANGVVRGALRSTLGIDFKPPKNKRGKR